VKHIDRGNIGIHSNIRGPESNLCRKPSPQEYLGTGAGGQEMVSAQPATQEVAMALTRIWALCLVSGGKGLEQVGSRLSIHFLTVLGEAGSLNCQYSIASGLEFIKTNGV
jgi:hypothetical protein